MSIIVEVNFILDKEAGKIFDGNLDADTIITNLTAFKNAGILYLEKL